MSDAEPWYHVAVWALRPPLALWFDWRFEGMERIPRRGPLLVAGNHISYLDPLAHALMLTKAGRRPRFLVKAELFGHPLLRRVLEGTSQIRVERGTGSAAPVDAAREALAAGETVVVYPEATITTQPDFSPMRGKTGVARIALSTGVPVLPIAVWGSQPVWGRGGPGSLAFGRPIWLRAGTPLRFSESDAGPEGERRAADAVMAELARIVADLRSRYPKRWDA